MRSQLGELWNRERASGFTGLSGSRVSGVVPVRQALVDHFVSQWRSPHGLENLQIRLLPSNMVYVSADVRVFGFRKHVDLTVKVAQAVDFQHRPTLRLLFAERSALAFAATLAAPLLGRLPQGVSIANEMIVIDLADLLASRGAGDLLRPVRALAIEGQEGVIWLNVDIEIDPAGAPRAPLVERPSRAPRSSGQRLMDVIPTLDGTRLDVQLHVRESLATEAIAAALADANGEPRESASIDWRTLASLVTAPRVHFQQQTMIVETEVQIGVPVG
jgi:hypothetical protein